MERPPKRRRIPDVAEDQLGANRAAMPRREIIKDDDLVATIL
jgi:hypothetical protein